MEPYEKIAKTLRTDKDVIRIVSEKLSEYVGHDNNVAEKIIAENDERVERVMRELAIPSNNARDIYLFLISKIKKDDEKLAAIFHREKIESRSGFENVISFARQNTGVERGFFLKLDKARELLVKNPPEKIIKFLGYSDAEELVKKEDVFELFAAMRFMEGMGWMNDTFLKDYESLTPDDFEEREVAAIVLSDKWKKGAISFTEKKYHNLSHSKELGLVFIIPISIDLPGANFMDLSLAMHYFHEVEFYSTLFKKYAKESDSEFSGKVMSSLRGDVIDVRPPEDRLGYEWFVNQRYLAKDDNYDWRLFYPHVSPEALHWSKVERDIAKFSREAGLGLEFWEDLGYVGDFFKDESGVEILVSFNFLDTVMSLFKEKEMIKYLYHHQEAMWNKIFIEFMGEEKLEKLIEDNFYKGKIILDEKIK